MLKAKKEDVSQFPSIIDIRSRLNLKDGKIILILVLVATTGLVSWQLGKAYENEPIEPVYISIHVNTLEKDLKATQEQLEAHRDIISELQKENSELQEEVEEFLEKWSVGEFEATAYTLAEGNGDGVTSVGVVPKPNRTIAVDPDVIPYGSKVIVNGQDYIAEDTGGDIQGKRLDIFMSNREQALNFGRRKVEIIYQTK